MAQIKNYAFLSALSAVTACHFVDENDEMQAISSGKKKRKPYRRLKKVLKSCRNHGSCHYCRDNRCHNSDRKKSC